MVMSPVKLSTVGIAEIFRLPPVESGTLSEHIVSAPTLQSSRRHLKTFYYSELSASNTLMDLVVISVT